MQIAERIVKMSEPDKDALTGSVMREYKELGVELSTRLTKASKHADGYGTAFNYLTSRKPAYGGLRYSTSVDTLSTTPDPDEVKDNCAEVLKIIHRRAELFAQLVGMGMEPRDPPVPGI